MPQKSAEHRKNRKVCRQLKFPELVEKNAIQIDNPPESSNV